MANELVTVTKTYSIIRVQRTVVQGRNDPLNPHVLAISVPLDEVVETLRRVTKLNVRRDQVEQALERAKNELWTSARVTASGVDERGLYFEYWVQPV